MSFISLMRSPPWADAFETARFRLCAELEEIEGLFMIHGSLKSRAGRSQAREVAPAARRTPWRSIRP
jgi:hypothetical protein